jgi:hypothetical protein
MDEFGFGARLMRSAHRFAVLFGLIIGFLTFGYGIFIIALGTIRAGMSPPGEFEGPFCMFIAALAFGLTALATRPGRPIEPAELRELNRAIVLLDELQDKLAKESRQSL